MPEPKKPKVVVEQVKYIFTNEEKRVLGETLAREAQEVFSLRTQKKEVSSALAARIEEANGRVAITTDKINQGYEMRDAECAIVFDVPRRGMKSYIRMDTHEAVREEAMTSSELQDSFAFNEPDEAATPAPADEEAQPFQKRRGRPPKEVN
jgi:hypothetical protein